MSDEQEDDYNPKYGVRMRSKTTEEVSAEEHGVDRHGRYVVPPHVVNPDEPVLKEQCEVLTPEESLARRARYDQDEASGWIAEVVARRRAATEKDVADFMAARAAARAKRDSEMTPEQRKVFEETEKAAEADAAALVLPGDERAPKPTAEQYPPRPEPPADSPERVFAPEKVLGPASLVSAGEDQDVAGKRLTPHVLLRLLLPEDCLVLSAEQSLDFGDLSACDPDLPLDEAGEKADKLLMRRTFARRIVLSECCPERRCRDCRAQFAADDQPVVVVGLGGMLGAVCRACRKRHPAKSQQALSRNELSEWVAEHLGELRVTREAGRETAFRRHREQCAEAREHDDDNEYGEDDDEGDD